jgi:WD40 repeat protein
MSPGSHMLRKLFALWIVPPLITTFILAGWSSWDRPPASPDTKPFASLPAVRLLTASLTPAHRLALSAPGTLPPPIAPLNAAYLTQAAQIDLGPWELVHALAWSPDGERLAVSAGEWLYLYPYPSLDPPATIDLGVWSPGLAFSPDGRWIATGGRDGVIQLWQTSSRTKILEIEAHKKGLNDLAFNPVGDLLASGGNDGMARLWDPHSGEQRIQMIGGSFAIPAIGFTQDGKALAILNGGVVRVRELESGRFVRTLSGEGSYFSLDIAQGDRILALGGADNRVEIWDQESESQLFTLSGHQGQPGRFTSLIWEVEFNPQGTILASAGGDGAARLWDTASGKSLANLEGHANGVTSLAFSPDGTLLATGGLDGKVKLWQVSE